VYEYEYVLFIGDHLTANSDEAQPGAESPGLSIPLRV